MKDNKKILLSFWNKCKAIAKAANMDLPKNTYRYAPFVCWNCNKEILVYIWPGSSEWSGEMPDGRPRTVQFRFSATAGHKYWVNVCPFCNRIQGDFFLKHELGGPFLAFVCGNNTVEDWKSDMRKLAYLWKNGYEKINM